MSKTPEEIELEIIKKLTTEPVTLYVDPGEQLKLWKKYRDNKGKPPVFTKPPKEEEGKVEKPVKGDHYLVALTWQHGCDLKRYADDVVWIKEVRLSFEEKDIE